MSFFGMFRSKEEKLSEAIAELYSDVGLAAFKSSIAVQEAFEEKIESTMEPSASHDLRCEFFCFYAHIVDYLLLGEFGESRALSVRAQLVPSGIEPFLRSSLSQRGEEVWDPNLTDSLTKVKRVLDLSSKVMDLIEHNIAMGIEYFKSQEVFASDVNQAHKRGDVPGLSDVLSEEPDSKVSRLVRNTYKTLQAYNPELGPDLNVFHERPDTVGSDAEAIGFVELCRTIHISVYVEIFHEIKLPERLHKMGRLFR